jgi:hypothetical protein
VDHRAAVSFIASSHHAVGAPGIPHPEDANPDKLVIGNVSYHV